MSYDPTHVSRGIDLSSTVKCTVRKPIKCCGAQHQAAALLKHLAFTAYRQAAGALLACVFLTSLSCDSDVAPAPVVRNGVALEPISLSFPSRTALVATLEGPDGTTFRATSYSSGDQQVLRLTPSVEGDWRYLVTSGSRVTEKGIFRVNRPTTSGFVRRRGNALVHEDGTAFVAIGENRINIYDAGWNWKALSIEDYLEHMARHGMTVLRVFVVTDIENEADGSRNQGVIEPALGHFDERVAQQFDRIFRSAQTHGIYIVLVAFALGFSVNDDWKSWQDNPYSVERGGPARTRYEFFDSPAARAHAGGRIRYLAARYSAFPNLLAVDLLNEPEWDGGIPEVSWASWAEAMAAEWRRVDPYDHLVTVGSVGLHWNIEGDERNWWSSDACDIVQWHLYGPEVYDVHSLASEMSRKIRETWVHGKPVLVGEFAYGGEAKPEYDHTHVGLWSAAFSGAAVLAHSAPTFNVDSDEVMTPQRARHFIVLRKVLAELGAATPVATSTRRGAFAWALFSEQRNGAIWVLAPKSRYGSAMQGERVSLPVASNGTWHVRWIDDVSGDLISDTEATATANGLHLDVPPFQRHVVAQLSRARSDR